LTETDRIEGKVTAPAINGPVKLALVRAVTRALTSRWRRDLARSVRGLGRRLSGRAPVIDYFHTPDDPYSHVAVQTLAALSARYGVTVRCHVAPPPEDSAAPEREKLAAYALRDAPVMAAEYGLSFPTDAKRPDPALTLLAARALTAALAEDALPDRARVIGEALWTGDRATLETVAMGASRAEAEAALAAGGALRRKLGHYLGAMLHFEGEWYWGVDRLNHLEERLAAMGRDSMPGKPMIAPYRDIALPPGRAHGGKATIEFWFSFRSPYTWIAVPRVRRLARHYGADLKLRYILPMVMRGLPVPPMKTIYIALDTKREADRVNLPYGTIVDPVGAGAARALAVMHKAVALGKGEDFAELAMKAAFADGIPIASDAGMLDVAKRAGLTEAQMRQGLADDSWRPVADANRQALFDAGLWGAPTYRVNGLPAHWGQDRLWALEHDLARACDWRAD
jgi:2-hydroxychromene-2-carboxylate isomerase